VSNQAWLNIIPGQIVQVEIDSRRYWNCAAVWLESEGRYDFEIQGNQHWVDFYRCVDANGYNIAVLQNARWARRNPRFNWFALVGCIERVSSSEFLIGKSRMDYAPTKSGRLFCFANDAWFTYWNNWGSLVLTIRRRS
jgi:hypothetical protein